MEYREIWNMFDLDHHRIIEISIRNFVVYRKENVSFLKKQNPRLAKVERLDI